MNRKIREIHMIGIGGYGMSGIAEVLLNLEYTVTGSDLSESSTIQRLKRLGATISTHHSEENICAPQVVVRSTAIADDNPEIIAAKAKHIPVIGRAEMLAELMRLRKGIAIAGTHGKTTTTSLIASIFDADGRDPTVIIGGLLNSYGTNARLGSGQYLIAEADESDSSFLCLFPIINVVTNIGFDHIDYFGTQEKIDEAFISYMNKVPFYGVNIICGDDEGCQRVMPHVKRPIITYGFNSDNTIRAEIIRLGVQSHFNVFHKVTNAQGTQCEEFWGEVILNQPGQHNVLNALAAIGLSIEIGIKKESCIKGLADFKGVGRRFEHKGQVKSIDIVDDYGHHPVEIIATIACAKKVFPNRRILMAFQPHRFTRTQSLFGEFCECFEGLDKLFLSEIYAASEKPIAGISGQSLAQGITQVSQTEVEFIAKVADMEDIITSQLEKGDVLITQGAGNITQLSSKIFEKLS